MATEIKIAPAVMIGLLLLLSRVGKTSTKPTPGPTPATRFSKADLVALALKHGFPDPNLAAAVALAESGGDPRALNNSPPREISVGLWQINTLAHKAHTVAQLFDPDLNASVARKILDDAKSWKPWGAYTNGSYKKYL